MRKPANNYAKMQEEAALSFSLHMHVRYWGRMRLVCNWKGFEPLG